MGARVVFAVPCGDPAILSSTTQRLRLRGAQVGLARALHPSCYICGTLPHAALLIGYSTVRPYKGRHLLAGCCCSEDRCGLLFDAALAPVSPLSFQLTFSHRDRSAQRNLVRRNRVSTDCGSGAQAQLDRRVCLQHRTPAANSDPSRQPQPSVRTGSSMKAGFC